MFRVAVIVPSPVRGTTNGDDEPLTDDHRPPVRPRLQVFLCHRQSQRYRFILPTLSSLSTFLLLSHHLPNARVKLRLPCPEQGLGLHILSTVRQARYVSF
jgi:hypothetical protein